MPVPTLSPRLRLALLVAVLTAAFAVFWIGDVITEERVRNWTEAFGPAAPVAYVVLSAALGLALVPGPLLAGASGLLFGPVLGFGVTLAASVLSALASLVIARRVGRPGVAEMSGPRLTRVSDTLERHGLVAVIAQRLAPGVPDAPASYAAGLLRVRAWHLALGTLIGSAPRGFSYTALGSTVSDPTSTLGLVSLALLALTAVAGIFVGRMLLRRGRLDG